MSRAPLTWVWGTPSGMNEGGATPTDAACEDANVGKLHAGAKGLPMQDWIMAIRAVMEIDMGVGCAVLFLQG